MRRYAALKAAALVLSLTFAAAASGEEPQPGAENAIDAEARALVDRAGDFLRDAKRFAFVAESGYDVVQADGSKLEFGASRRYLVQRPDRVRVETEPRDAAPRLTVFDGKTLVQADSGENVYARADLEKPRDLDFVIDLVRERLDAPLPLGELLRNNPRAALADSLESAAVVGSERLRGVECDHIALRNPDADVQLWIARGEQPFVLRVVITYRTLDGQPSFWADLDGWSLAPEIVDASFRFVPPAGAERVRFEVRASPPPPSTEGAP
jgi:hypothetical protein